ncbi:hypothetical protein C7M84_025592 [Penaeus vannamei]|uniref:Uncharacterized protein n=1 Tax=Penaeus vannamei TaxID=6689 RepID=A0A423TXQ6_PENVA|nr:hypothetical protein C7M84_025592 [Penaeus vannamei]
MPVLSKQFRFWPIATGNNEFADGTFGIAFHNVGVGLQNQRFHVATRIPPLTFLPLPPPFLCLSSSSHSKCLRLDSTLAPSSFSPPLGFYFSYLIFHGLLGTVSLPPSPILGSISTLSHDLKTSPPCSPSFFSPTLLLLFSPTFSLHPCPLLFLSHPSPLFFSPPPFSLPPCSPFLRPLFPSPPFSLPPYSLLFVSHLIPLLFVSHPYSPSFLSPHLTPPFVSTLLPSFSPTPPPTLPLPLSHLKLLLLSPLPSPVSDLPTNISHISDLRSALSFTSISPHLPVSPLPHLVYFSHPPLFLSHPHFVTFPSHLVYFPLPISASPLRFASLSSPSPTTIADLHSPFHFGVFPPLTIPLFQLVFSPFILHLPRASFSLPHLFSIPLDAHGCWSQRVST